ncbi:PD-(D/E)XK motif protein [Bdellovibrio sp. HCB274]|uniref:PD-(D/E)XK motif protein n=1 Tax=Bdellovibrio sp. HCB274 TaxID=3394361 RepID=UPI0039B58D7E
MTMNKNRFERIWAEILKEKNLPGMRSIESTLMADIFLTIDRSGRRGVAIASRQKCRSSGNYFERKGIEYLSFSQGELVGHHLIERSPNSPEFPVLVEELLDKRYYVGCKCAENYLVKFDILVSKWASLFDKLNTTTYHELKGLFGELVVLDILLSSENDEIVVLDGWVGPLSRANDFHFAALKLEVKTKENISETVSISSIEQLSGDPYLVVVSVTSNTGLLISDLIESIFNKFKSERGRTLFGSKLIELGVSLAIVKKLNLRFSADEISCYHVTGGFPRLVQQSVMLGVENVRYEINLKYIMPFRVETDGFLGKLKIHEN